MATNEPKLLGSDWIAKPSRYAPGGWMVITMFQGVEVVILPDCTQWEAEVIADRVNACRGIPGEGLRIHPI